MLWLLAARRCGEALDPARGACDAVEPETTIVSWPAVSWPPWCGADANSEVPCPVPRVRSMCRRESNEEQDLTRNEAGDVTSAKKVYYVTEIREFCNKCKGWILNEQD